MESKFDALKERLRKLKEESGGNSAASPVAAKPAYSDREVRQLVTRGTAEPSAPAAQMTKPALGKDAARPKEPGVKPPEAVGQSPQPRPASQQEPPSPKIDYDAEIQARLQGGKPSVISRQTPREEQVKQALSKRPDSKQQPEDSMKPTVERVVAPPGQEMAKEESIELPSLDGKKWLTRQDDIGLELAGYGEKEGKAEEESKSQAAPALAPGAKSEGKIQLPEVKKEPAAQAMPQPQIQAVSEKAQGQPKAQVAPVALATPAAVEPAKLSVPIPPYPAAPFMQVERPQGDGKKADATPVQASTLTPAPQTPEGAGVKQFVMEEPKPAALQEPVEEEKPEASHRARRLYLVNKGPADTTLISPQPGAGDNTASSNITEIRVTAPPEVAEQEGFDTMVKDVYTQLKATSAKGGGAILALPPEKEKKAPDAKGQAPSEPQPSSLFDITPPRKLNPPAGDNPPQLPASPAAKGDGGSRDLFAELSKVNGPPEGEKPKKLAEQVKFVEIPREKGMGCPNCRETSTRVVFCPYCGSGMCANCSPNIRPEQDFFVYTCPRCGEEINVSKKA